MDGRSGTRIERGGNVAALGGEEHTVGVDARVTTVGTAQVVPTGAESGAQRRSVTRDNLERFAVEGGGGRADDLHGHRRTVESE